MPVSSQQLDNAGVDLDDIAEVANGDSHVVTMRQGRQVPTVTLAIDKIKAPSYSAFSQLPALTEATAGYYQVLPEDAGTHASVAGDVGSSGGQTPNAGFFRGVVGTGYIRIGASQAGRAESAAALAGQYANASTDTPIPGAPSGERGALYWVGRANAVANSATDADIPGFAPGTRGAQYWANRAQQSFVSTSTVLSSSVKNGGKGEVNDVSGGISTELISSGLSISKILAEVNSDGTLGRVHDSIDTKTGIRKFYITYAFKANIEKLYARSFESVDTSRPFAFAGQTIVGLPPATRVAFGVGNYLSVDTVDEVLRIPGAIRAMNTRNNGYNLPDAAVVDRGGMFGVLRKKRFEQYQCPADASVLMVQGSAMRPKNKRTHQQCPTMAMSGRYFYVAFSAANKTFGGDFHDAEGPDSYVAICRRPISGGAWEEVAQALPSGPNYRVSDPAMQTMKDGRVAVFLPFATKGTDTEHYSQGAYVSFIENPDAPVGGKLVFTNPVFDGAYGFHSTGFFEDGIFKFVSYIPMPGYPTSQYWDNYYSTTGIRFVPPGAYLSAFISNGVSGWPYVEPLSRIPAETNAAYESYTEPQIVPLVKSLGATYDYRLTTRSTQGPREAWGTKASNGQVTWTELAPCTKYNGNAASTRRRELRTQAGNLLYVGNLDPGSNRRAMGVAISQNEGQTFAYQLIVESASSEAPYWNVSYPDAVSFIDPSNGRAKIALVHDEGRGVGPGLPANFWFYIVDEADVIAGTVTTAQTMAARELVSQLQYEA